MAICRRRFQSDVRDDVFEDHYKAFQFQTADEPVVHVVEGFDCSLGSSGRLHSVRPLLAQSVENVPHRVRCTLLADMGRASCPAREPQISTCSAMAMPSGLTIRRTSLLTAASI